MRLKADRRVKELGARASRISRAYLAEAYDGIGQYVKISMTKGGVTNALQGRIASGDFGGGRTFPVGTPVHIVVYHGQVEVFLGNLPHVCDLMNRVTDEPNGGWGISPYGPWLTVTEMTEILPDPTHDENGWMEDGSGILQYSHSVENDPSMGLKFPEGLSYPIDYTVEFHTTGAVREVSVNNFVFYLGPQYYDDFNTWLVVVGFRDDAVHSSLFFVDSNDASGFVWPLGPTGILEVFESREEAEVPYRVHVMIDETGTHVNAWHTGQLEPEGWQLTEPWTGTPPPASYYRFLYIETQGFNSPISSTQPKFHVDTFCLNEQIR